MNVIYTDMVFSPSWDPSVEISAQLVPWHPQGPSTPHLPPVLPPFRFLPSNMAKEIFKDLDSN